MTKRRTAAALAPIKERCIELRRQGLILREIAEQTGESKSSVHRLTSGVHNKADPAAVDRLYAVVERLENVAARFEGIAMQEEERRAD